jgi:hypothetical protein
MISSLPDSEPEIIAKQGEGRVNTQVRAGMAGVGF